MEIDRRYVLMTCLMFATFSFVMLACKEQPQTTTAFDHIKDEKVKAILKRSIDGHGGLDAWQKIKYLSYLQPPNLLKNLIISYL